MTAGFPDHFSAQAADYRAFRPAYPDELFAFLASAAPARGLAWDAGTGSGQAAVGLAGHFERVLATDASAEQLRNAEPHPRVEYAVARAEACPLPDRSVDLVVVAQALHWFDRDRFYSEVRRVCRPGGVLAATCYFQPGVNPEVDSVLRRWEDFIRPYWTPERTWVDAGYRTIPFPFPEIEAPRFRLSVDATLARFIGYLGTWSAARQYLKAHGSDPLERFAHDFAAAWGDPAAVRAVHWQFNVRLGRVG
jgi:ubiquinone/menaquinone biosynthesis C-methylase UbiE